MDFEVVRDEVEKLLGENWEQLHLKGDVGLVTFADNPLVAVDVHDVVRRQVLHVDEREGGEAHEYKDVTHEGQIVILELMGYDGLWHNCPSRPTCQAGLSSYN